MSERPKRYFLSVTRVSLALVEGANGVRAVGYLLVARDFLFRTVEVVETEKGVLVRLIGLPEDPATGPNLEVRMTLAVLEMYHRMQREVQ